MQILWKKPSSSYKNLDNFPPGAFYSTPAIRHIRATTEENAFKVSLQKSIYYMWQELQIGAILERRVVNPLLQNKNMCQGP